MSGLSPDGDRPSAVLPEPFGWVIGVRETLIAPGMPAVALVGGVGVTVRLAAVGAPLRATADIDVVARGDEEPTALTVLSRHPEASPSPGGARVAGMKVDVMETLVFTDDDLLGLSDGDRLFVAAHGWAFDTAAVARVGTVDREVDFPVATPAALVAMKCHAIAHARSGRRANKRGGDVYDLFALVDRYDRRGGLGTELAAAPWHLGRLVASVVQAELLARPEQTMREIASTADTVVTVGELRDVLESFVDSTGSSPTD